MCIRDRWWSGRRWRQCVDFFPGISLYATAVIELATYATAVWWLHRSSVLARFQRALVFFGTADQITEKSNWQRIETILHTVLKSFDLIALVSREVKRTQIYVKLEIRSVGRDICLIATSTMNELFHNCSRMHGACMKRLYVHFRSKIWRHRRVPRDLDPDFL